MISVGPSVWVRPLAVFGDHGGEGVPVFDDLAVFDPPDVESGEGGGAKAVVGALGNYEVAFGNDASGFVAELVGQGGHEGFQALCSVRGQGGVLGVGRAEVLFNRIEVAFAEKFGGGGDDSFCGAKLGVHGGLLGAGRGGGAAGKNDGGESEAAGSGDATGHAGHAVFLKDDLDGAVAPGPWPRRSDPLMRVFPLRTM